MGLGSLSWAGHQIHVALPITAKLLDAGISLSDIPLPHEFIINRNLIGSLYPLLFKRFSAIFWFKLVYSYYRFHHVSWWFESSKQAVFF